MPKAAPRWLFATISDLRLEQELELAIADEKPRHVAAAGFEHSNPKMLVPRSD